MVHPASRRRVRRACGLGLVLALGSQGSRAQDSAPSQQNAILPSPARSGGAARASFGVDLAASYQSEVGSTSYLLAPLLEGALFVHRHVAVALTWGAAGMVDNQGLGESTGRVGNPMLSAVMRRDEGPWCLRSSLGITVPLAHFPLGPDGRLYQFVYNQSLAMWGMWNQWLWLPDRMAAPATGWVSYTLPSGQSLVAESALAPVIGARDKRGGFMLVEQIALEARLPIGGGFALHPRLQGVVLPSTSIDRFQSAAGLRVTHQSTFGRFFAGLLVNLDPPVGVLRGLGRWGLHVGKEIEL